MINTTFAISYHHVMHLNIHVQPTNIVISFWQSENQRWKDIAKDLVRLGEHHRAEQAAGAADAYQELAAQIIK